MNWSKNVFVSNNDNAVVMSGKIGNEPEQDEQILESQNSFKKLDEKIKPEEKFSRKILTEYKDKETFELKTMSGKNQQTVVTANASVQQKPLELKTQSRSETLLGGLSEDIIIEAKKNDSASKVKETKSDGDMGQVKDEKDENEGDDAQQRKKDFEFISDILAYLFRLGIIKKR